MLRSLSFFELVRVFWCSKLRYSLLYWLWYELHIKKSELAVHLWFYCSPIYDWPTMLLSMNTYLKVCRYGLHLYSKPSICCNSNTVFSLHGHHSSTIVWKDWLKNWETVVGYVNFASSQLQNWMKSTKWSNKFYKLP